MTMTWRDRNIAVRTFSFSVSCSVAFTKCLNITCFNSMRRGGVLTEPLAEAEAWEWTTFSKCLSAVAWLISNSWLHYGDQLGIRMYVCDTSMSRRDSVKPSPLPFWTKYGPSSVVLRYRCAFSRLENIQAFSTCPGDLRDDLSNPTFSVFYSIQPVSSSSTYAVFWRAGVTLWLLVLRFYSLHVLEQVGWY